MPSRWICVLIVVCWMSTVGWFFYREVWLKAQTDRLPPFVVDLTDEAGTTAAWAVYSKGMKVASGISSIKSLKGRTFELSSRFAFSHFNRNDANPDKKDLQERKSGGELLKSLRSMQSKYVITEDGKLVSFETSATADFGFRVTAEIRGKVKNELLRPKLILKGFGPVDIDDVLEKVPPVSVKHAVLNPMHLVNRVPGLRVGQHGKIPLMDPLTAAIPGAEDLGVQVLEAKVVAGRLHWEGRSRQCFKIEYSEPGKQVIAATWVRQRDGLVLQQQASFQNMELVFVREPLEQTK